MGVGAAVIFPTTLALITNIFPDAVARAKAIGLWAAMVGVGVAAGPITEAGCSSTSLGAPSSGERSGRRCHRRWMAIRTDLAGPGHPASGRGRADPVCDRGNRFGLHRHRSPQSGVEQRANGHRVHGRRAVLVSFAIRGISRPHPMLDVSVFANRRFSGGSLAVTAGFHPLRLHLRHHTRISNSSSTRRI